MTRTQPPAPATTVTIALALLVAGLAAPAAAAADRDAKPAMSAVAEAVATADRFYAQRDFEGALLTCRAALATDSTAYDLWWRLARSLTDRGARATYDGAKPKAQAAFEDAVAAARRAVGTATIGAAGAKGDRPEGHLELAVALGRLALFKGGKDKIRLSKEIKTEADRALAVDSQQDRAHHVLGRWNRGIAELSFFEKTAANTILGGLPKGATYDAAVTHFEQAIAINPGYANHHVELGRTLLKLGLKAKARAEFETALACPVKTPFDAEYKNEARELLVKAKAQ